MKRLERLASSGQSSRGTESLKRRIRSLSPLLLTLLFATSSGVATFAQYFGEGGRQSQAQQSMVRREIVPELKFEGIRMTWVGDRHLEISFRLHVTGKVVGFDEALHVVPCYEAEGAIHSFPIILINDPTRHGYYRREMELLDREQFVAHRPAHTVVLQGKRTDEWVSYRQLLELPKGVSRSGKVQIYQFIQDCCDLTEVGAYNAGRVQASRQPLQEELREAKPTPEPVRVAPKATAPRLLPPEITTSDVRFMQPPKEVVKERKELHIVRIQFRVGKWDILPGFAQNYQELERVEQAMRPLLRGDEVQLLSASIRGYASPEATEGFNRQLSQRRADSFKQYIQSRYGLFHLSHFPAIGMGEDWQGLREAIQRDQHLPSRWAILYIIDNVYDLDQREARIKQLAGGMPYQYLLNNHYPPLRRMVMELQYKVREYTTEEAERLISTRPQELSQEEIYQVAQRRHQGQKRSQNYGTEYDIAARYFSEDLIANLNASSAALVRGDYDRAWSYLQRIQQEPQAYNNLGLYYWGVGDSERALRYLRQATQVPETRTIARDNLQRLQQALWEQAVATDRQNRRR